MTDPDFRRYICEACGYIYDEAKGDPDSGLAPGTRYEAIPDDWQCPLCGMMKSDLRLLPDQPDLAKAGPGASRNRDRLAAAAARAALGAEVDHVSRGSAEHLVIVGAGVAGWSVAEAVRRRDPQRPTLLVAACDASVYPKPALSTALAQQRAPDQLIERSAVEHAAQLGIEVRTRTRVLKLDPTRRRLITGKGPIDYGQLVLALGARPRALKVAGEASDSLLQVNDLPGYRRLRATLDQGVRHVTLLGAGLIGCELADDLSAGGFAVTLVDPAERPLSRLLPAPLSTLLQTRFADVGIDWRLGDSLMRLDPAAKGQDGAQDNGQSIARYRAHLARGAEIHTDLVIAATGLVANVTLAKKAGLAVDQGIQVDRAMRTSLPGIFALGDCATVEGQAFSFIEPIRRQAEAIAASLCDESEPFVPMPPLIRVKTPTLPLTVCGSPAALADSNAWTVIETSDQSLRMEYQGGQEAGAFASAGKPGQPGQSGQQPSIQAQA